MMNDVWTHKVMDKKLDGKERLKGCVVFVGIERRTYLYSCVCGVVGHRVQCACS